MNMNDLQPAKAFARNFGVKVVLYGSPGSGKTPVAVTTTPRPVLLLSEPGALTLRGSDVPTFPAFNPVKIDEFWTWAFNSAEAKNFDTIIWDSASQGAEIYVDKELGGTSKAGNQVDGRQAYGKMARRMMEILSQAYFMPQKHIVLVAKMMTVEQQGIQYSRPYFPGKELNVRVPHLFDMILQSGRFPTTGPNVMLKCQESFDSMARDRSATLGMYEQPHLGNIFARAMA